jgi:hypothetical protein
VNNRRLRGLVESLVLESGIEPPPARARNPTVPRKESPWRGFVQKIKSGQSVVLPTRQTAGLITTATHAGFHVQTNRVGNVPWKGADLGLVGYEKNEEVVIHQTRVWFFKNERDPI